MVVALGSNNRRSGSAAALRRRGKKFSEATLLRMLFVMLGVIFVLYASLMIVIARYTHTHHPSSLRAVPAPQQSSTSADADADAVNADGQEQQRRDLRPPLDVNADADADARQRIEKTAQVQAETETQPREWKERTLKAYIEPIDQKSWDVKPLPVRKTTAHDLKVVQYPQLSSCSRLPEQWPVDNFPEDDPFLPWIHDVFPTSDGKFIQFVAQNRRRCDTGAKSDDDRKKIMHRQPQLALFQHVPVKRIDGGRYRLAAHQQADADGMETRFICRFKPSMDETLSVHNLNYDYVSFRKNHKQTFTKLGKWDVKALHTSQLVFQCPVPEHLQQQVRDGSSVIDDFATLFVDVIPIRTPPRYGPPDAFLPPRYAESINKTAEFKPDDEWGENHILPKIDDSGRWENIPICKPSLMTYDPQADQKEKELNKKANRLVSCLWASAGYATRGERFSISDGQRRLREWLHYVFLIGFDHVFVYDNSGAQSNQTSLKPITDEFPGKVTRIVWPSKVCNVSSLFRAGLNSIIVLDSTRQLINTRRANLPFNIIFMCLLRIIETLPTVQGNVHLSTLRSHPVASGSEITRTGLGSSILMNTCLRKVNTIMFLSCWTSWRKKERRLYPSDLGEPGQERILLSKLYRPDRLLL
jgi:hypothetical protein